jgi:glucose-1-phosphatase
VIKALIFDLCDTIVRTAGVPGLLNLSGITGRYSAEEVENWFVHSEVFRAYERGEVDTTTFFAAFCSDLELCADADELNRAYEDLILHEIDGMADLVRRLSSHYPLYALSNNNPLLWRGTQRVCSVLGCFEHIFLSHEIGLLKPDSHAFFHVLAQIDCKPAEVILIDDNPLCIEAAEKLGMATVLFSDAENTARALATIPGVKKLA